MKRKRCDSVADDSTGDFSTRYAQENGRGALREEFAEESGDDSDYDSLFDEDGAESVSCQHGIGDVGGDMLPASRTAPSIPGIYFDPTVLIPVDIAERLWKDCMRAYFHGGDVNQVMLFERVRSSRAAVSDMSTNGNTEECCQEARESGLPEFLLELLDTLKELLRDVLPDDVHTLLFPSDDKSHQARQAILNHYRPGEGIAPHVDLLNRYGDGIIGVSLRNGTVMDFAKVGDPLRVLSNGSDGSLPNPSPESYGVYLPERSIFVLTGEARYKWTHAIARRSEDLVESPDRESVELLPRGERLSITFRWLLPGADVVGD